MNAAEIARAMHVVDSDGPIPIRVASAKDATTFRSFFKAFVIDQARRGGQIAGEDRTMAALYEPLFWAYVNGERNGVCLLAGIQPVVGILLWGDTLAPSPIAFRDGPVAQGWGVYVEPSMRGTGISRRMRKAARKILRDMGFKRLVGSAVLPEPVRKAVQEARPEEFAALESALGAGFRWEEVTGSLYLDEEA